MKCSLHIGSEKTGTTSFQVHMSRNRPALAAMGVLYPLSLGDVNHRAITLVGQEPGKPDPSLLHAGLKTQEDHAQAVARITANFGTEVRRTRDAHTCLISSEHLHSRLKTADDVLRLRDFLAPFFSDVTVYLHLRPQVDVLVSLTSTATRMGMFVGTSMFDATNPKSPYYNYKHIVSIWENAFGANALRLVAFQRERDFAKRLFGDLGLDLAALGPMNQLNEALDVRVMAMVNTVVAARVACKLPLDFLESLPLEQPLRLSRALAMDIQNRFADSNEALIAHRSDLSDGDFTPDWQRYPEVGNESMLVQPCNFAGPLAALAAAFIKSQPKA